MKYVPLLLLLSLLLSSCGGGGFQASADPVKSSSCTVLTGSPNVLAFDGDSLTVGFSGSNGLIRWTDNVVVPDGFVRYNVANGGWQLTDMDEHARLDLDSKVNPRAQWNVLVVFGGTNDQDHVNVATTLQRLQSYVSHRRAAGWKVIVVTLPSRVGGDAFKNQFNAYLRAHWRQFADGLADFGASPEIGADRAYENQKYFLADGFHMTPEGYGYLPRIATEAVSKLLFTCGG